MELVSIVIPVYKVEEYIDKCIESVTKQSYTDIEIILVDDGSPDKCGKICEKWAKEDDRIKVIHKKNGGLSDARNEGINVAKGKYITFIDSDDYVQQNYVEYLCQLMKKYDSDISCCLAQIFYEDGKVSKIENEVIEECLTSEDAFREMLYERKLTNSAWAKLYKIDLFNGVRYPKGKLYEDMFTTYKLIMKSKKIAISNDRKYYYLIRSNSIIGSINPLKQKDMLDAAEEMYRYANEYVPSVVEATKYKIFMCSINILVQCKIFSKDSEEKELKKLLWKNIKHERLTFITNKNVSNKIRILAVVSLAGKQVLQIFYKILAKR